MKTHNDISFRTRKYVGDFSRVWSRSCPGANPGNGISRVSSGRDPGISRDTGKLLRTGILTQIPTGKYQVRNLDGTKPWVEVLFMHELLTDRGTTGRFGGVFGLHLLPWDFELYVSFKPRRKSPRGEDFIRLDLDLASLTVS